MKTSCPLRRPQANCIGRASGRPRAPRGPRTWHFCLTALVLLLFTTMAATWRSAVAAPAPIDPASRGAGVEIGRALPVEPLPAPLPGAGAPRLISPVAVVGRLAPSRQGRQLRAQVTAYSASVEEGTAWGITRSGTLARPGVVAVDPTVIPLGSRVRIAGLPGIYRAEDTGGGIHGAHIDVFMESRVEALDFGRRTSVLVEVLD